MGKWLAEAVGTRLDLGQAYDVRSLRISVRLGTGLVQARCRLGTGLGQAYNRLGKGLEQSWDKVETALGHVRHTVLHCFSHQNVLFNNLLLLFHHQVNNIL